MATVLCWSQILCVKKQVVQHVQKTMQPSTRYKKQHFATSGDSHRRGHGKNRQKAAGVSRQDYCVEANLISFLKPARNSFVSLVFSYFERACFFKRQIISVLPNRTGLNHNDLHHNNLLVEDGAELVHMESGKQGTQGTIAVQDFNRERHRALTVKWTWAANFNPLLFAWVGRYVGTEE